MLKNNIFALLTHIFCIIASIIFVGSLQMNYSVLPIFAIFLYTLYVIIGIKLKPQKSIVRNITSVSIITIIGLILYGLSFITFAEDKNPINENNWLNHPLIVEIRSIYNEVEDLISKQTLTKKKEFEDEGPGITEKEIYFDINNIARKFVMKGGSEDSALKYSFYYDSKQVLRFVFIEGGAVCGSVMEHRIYFNKNGKRIWENQKYLKEPEGYWEKTWPDKSLVYDPWKEFNLVEK